MKKQTYIIILLLIVFYSILMYFVSKPLVDNYFKKKSIKVGQVWEMRSDDPFETDVFYFEIIGVEGDYVQYVRFGSDTTSNRKDFFILGTDCVKNCD